MTEPTSMEEYSAKVNANSRASGTGALTAQHLPCPACGEPDWKVVMIAQDVPAQYEKPSTCKHCGRTFAISFAQLAGAFGIGRRPPPNRSSFGLIQTGGPDPAPWMQPKIPRQP